MVLLAFIDLSFGRTHQLSLKVEKSDLWIWGMNLRDGVQPSPNHLALFCDSEFSDTREVLGLMSIIPVSPGWFAFLI